jgi:hypothetical protein
MPKSPFSMFSRSGDNRPWYEQGSPMRGARARRIAAVAAGVAITAVGAYAATNWVVSLNSGSSGEAQSGTVSNISITAIASPAAANLLFPGGTGDVVAKITNPNPFPVTVTAVNLPTSTTYAAGYSDSALTTANTNCTATTSLVGWNFATGVSGSSHTLTSALTVGANATLTVTFTNDATMASTTPSLCQGTYFSMPSLTGVTATAGAGTATVSPATSSWTS